MRKNNLKYSAIAVLLVLLLSLTFNLFNENQDFELTVNQQYPAEYVRIVDGDTAVFKVNDVNFKTRFIGIDTPESVKENTPVEAYGKEASAFTKDALENAKEIILETDSEANLYDKHERLLAYVWIDGELLQCKLLEEGLAEVKYIYGDYRYLDKFYDAQAIAKAKHVNIWSN